MKTKDCWIVMNPDKFPLMVCMSEEDANAYILEQLAMYPSTKPSQYEIVESQIRE